MYIIYLQSESDISKDKKQQKELGSPLAPVQEGTEEYQEITEGKGLSFVVV